MRTFILAAFLAIGLALPARADFLNTLSSPYGDISRHVIASVQLTRYPEAGVTVTVFSFPSQTEKDAWLNDPQSFKPYAVHQVSISTQDLEDAGVKPAANTIIDNLRGTLQQFLAGNNVPEGHPFFGAETD